MQVGVAGTDKIGKTAGNIHESLNNADRLAYHRRRLMVKNNLAPETESKGGGDKMLLDLLHWGR